MQERSVTAGGQTYKLGLPFHVFATQNPVEQEGTYPLPEAQLDRFTMMLELNYPEANDEVEIIRATTKRERGPVSAVLDAGVLEAIQSFVRDIPVADHLLQTTVNSSAPPDPQMMQRLGLFLNSSSTALDRVRVNISSSQQKRAALRGKAPPLIFKILQR